MKLSKNDADYVREIIERAGLYAEVWMTKTTVAVEIEWGHVRQDHTRCLNVLQPYGFEQVRETVTDEDEYSPLYSSIHYFHKLRQQPKRA